MTEILEKAAEKLRAKLAGAELRAAVNFVIEEVGALHVDGARTPPEVRAGPGDAAVTITASQQTFRDLLSGSLDAAQAYFQGKLKLEGDLGVAMRLAAALG